MDQRTELPHDESAQACYERLMRYRVYLCAARVARDHGLGRSLVIEAAFKAFCRFDDLGFDEAALAVADEFGLTTLAASAEGSITCLRRIPGLNVLSLPVGRTRNGADRPN